jgi:mono/diheme cytochrome c family protein
MTRHARLAAVPLLFLPALPGAPAPVDAPDYARDVAPIFARRCVECHGPRKQESLLRLDSRKETLAGGMSGDAVVPGHARDSLLVKHLRGEARPPMPYHRPALEPAEIDRIAAWIDAGAPGSSDGPAPAREAARPAHWAYVKPVRPAVPPVSRREWVRNPVDAFVLARLDEEGLAPSPEAGRETLARRLFLDLVGLPPSPAEVDAFLADAGPDAYERLVDRLLASPRYGERWARPWLDLARYADTNGYEKDQARVAWRWRDWVIDAINRDLSFRDFTIEQLAGDMLPGATDEQRIATGFHRNSLLNQEGGIDVEEARFYVLVDRVNTTAAVWLGSTIACAQCHNHKFDPFPQKDYYRLMAFFDNGEYGVHGADDEVVQDKWIVEPELELGPPEVLARREALRREAAGLERERRTRPLEGELAAFEREIAGREAPFEPLAPRKAAARSGASLAKQADGSLLASGALAPTDVYTVSLRAPRDATALRVEALPDPSLPKRGPGRAPAGGFSLTGIEASAGGRRPVAFSRAFADGADPRRPAARVLDGLAATGWGASEEAEAGRRHCVTAALAQPLADRDVTLVLKFEAGTKEAPAALGRFRVLATTSDRPFAGLAVPPEVRTILDTAPAARTVEQRAALDRWFRPLAPSLEPVRGRLDAIRRALDAEPVGTAPVLRERAGFEKPSTLLRERGSFTSPGERVYAAVPAALGTLGEDQPPNRLGLARWLASPDNPLTARVAVDRLWQTVFGRGLVATPEDFGSQGERPSHPELLDWLAVEFVENGWSRKKLLRTIVTSATYRQSSVVTPELRERDPGNRLLARGARYRVEAEMVRDVALAAAGLLSPKIGGPSVFPEQPDGVWNVPYSSMKWTTSPGEDRHRRSLYTFIRRSSPYPSLVAFDAPSREACSVRRVSSNTPLQALVTLNDPVFVEAARALAARAAVEGGATAPERIAYAYRLCATRRPAPADLEALVAFHDREKARFAAVPGRARALLAAPGPGPDDSDGAALTMVANVLLSMDATLTRE